MAINSWLKTVRKENYSDKNSAQEKKIVWEFQWNICEF